MGVDVRTWVDVVKSHPLQFKFEGFVGFYTDVREAAVADEHFMYNHMYEEHESIAENIIDFLEPYIDYLVRELTVGKHDRQLIDDCHEPDYSEKLMARLEEAVGESRFEFAQYYVEPCEEWDRIRESDPDWLLEKHPPIECKSHAYEEGVPLEQVWFICPSCGNEPHTKETVDEEARQFYCGLCGGQKVGDDSWYEWFKGLEIVVWPFMKKEDVMYWTDPDDDTCSCLAEVVDVGEHSFYGIVSLRNDAGGEIEASRHELRPSTVEEYHHFHKEKEACREKTQM